MFYAASANLATPQNIVDAAVSSFNQQDSVEKHKTLSPIDKNRFVRNDPLYVDVPPYSLYYRVAVTLAANSDKEEAKALFGLDDNKIDAIVKRTNQSLDIGHDKTWETLNKIEHNVKRDGYNIPEPVRPKKEPENKNSELVTRTYKPQIELPPLSLARPRSDFKKTATPVAPQPAPAQKETPKEQQKSLPAAPSVKIQPRKKLSADMEKAAKPQGEKPVRKKRSELMLDKNVTSLTPPCIAEQALKLYDEMGFGLVSKEDFTGKFASENATKVREFVAYTSYRVLPYANYPLDRIAGGAYISTPVKDSLDKVEQNIRKQDKTTLSFLRELGDKLELTGHQKALLFATHLPRFKSWVELEELTFKGQKPLQSPVGP